jgi:UDPglucose--hexose-1-phosphate uridylyltransferase
MFTRALTKPDGRRLLLYSRRPIDERLVAPSPSPEPAFPNAHLRWHPLRGEWIAYATHRQHRTFLPPPEYNPLGPTIAGAPPTELPDGDYDAAVFENLFPTLTMEARDPPSLPVKTLPGIGVCEVVVFTRDAAGSLGALPLDHIELLVEVWADRYRTLGASAAIKYVFPFENRGVEVGVTLHHPHGQIYAYPFVPPVAARELAEQRAHLDEHGRGLVETLVAAELDGGARVLYAGERTAAFVPACARYPYEVWIATREAVASVADLDADGRADFARALKTVLLKYDGLWQRPFPYVMAFHQAPTDGEPHPEAHLHVELYPPYRMRDRLKFLAGSEIGAGVFTVDADPDGTAAELRRVEVSLG